jgi:hypothetical protein
MFLCALRVSTSLRFTLTPHRHVIKNHHSAIMRHPSRSLTIINLSQPTSEGPKIFANDCQKSSFPEMVGSDHFQASPKN